MKFKHAVNIRGAICLVLASCGAVSVIGHLPRPGQSVVSGLSLLTHEWFSQQTKLLSCLTSDLFCSQYQHCKLLIADTENHWSSVLKTLPKEFGVCNDVFPD